METKITRGNAAPILEALSRVYTDRKIDRDKLQKIADGIRAKAEADPSRLLFGESTEDLLATGKEAE